MYAAQRLVSGSLLSRAFVRYSSTKPSVCFIGAGPCTMSTLHFIAKDKEPALDITVYEKQSAVGGLWQEEGGWRTGVDEHGMPTHHSMYKDLWSNGPKECLEFPDYTFEDCFGVNIPSFPPRVILAEYIINRFKDDGAEKYTKLNHAVQQVSFDKDTDKFTVEVEDLPNKKHSSKEFDYVVCATGHFSTPHMPEFKGIESFPGRILHSHDYRSGFEFIGQDILVIGSSYSAEDITLQTLKFGAKSVTVSYRNNKMGFENWPKGYKGQHPLIKEIKGSTVHFIDGSSGEFDSILYCTGYTHYFPFLSPELRLETPNRLCPPLYKGISLPTNPKMLFLGMQDLFYTFTLFEIQAVWAKQYLEGKQKRPTQEEVDQDIAYWQGREEAPLPEGTKAWKQQIDVQSDYVNQLVKDTNYPYNLDCREIFYAWEKTKYANIVTYRDHDYTSMFTGKKSPVHHTKWWNAFNDSKEAFLEQDRSPELDAFNYRGRSRE